MSMVDSETTRDGRRSPGQTGEGAGGAEPDVAAAPQRTAQNMTGLVYVLVPGAGGSAWYWHRLEPELWRRGHEVIAVGLPAADDAAGLPEYADAVVQAVGRRSNLVLVAQSLGAFTAPLVCAHLPVELLVVLNPMIPRPNETPGEWWATTG